MLSMPLFTPAKEMITKDSCNRQQITDNRVGVSPYRRSRPCQRQCSQSSNSRKCHSGFTRKRRPHLIIFSPGIFACVAVHAATSLSSAPVAINSRSASASRPAAAKNWRHTQKRDQPARVTLRKVTLATSVGSAEGDRTCSAEKRTVNLACQRVFSLSGVGPVGQGI